MVSHLLWKSVSPVDKPLADNRKFGRWRSLGDSNPCFRRERATSWAARRREPGVGDSLDREAVQAREELRICHEHGACAPSPAQSQNPPFTAEGGEGAPACACTCGFPLPILPRKRGRGRRVSAG